MACGSPLLASRDSISLHLVSFCVAFFGFTLPQDLLKWHCAVNQSSESRSCADAGARDAPPMMGSFVTGDGTNNPYAFRCAPCHTLAHRW
jgi:hypothetical protein